MFITQKKTTTKTGKKKTTTSTTKKQQKKVKTQAQKVADKKTKKSSSSSSSSTGKKTKKSSSEKKTKYQLKAGTKKEAVLPDVSSSLSEDVRDELDSMSISDMKRVLKLNDCVCTGTKDELRNRVAWSIKNGVPKRCPECFSGRLKMDVNGSYFCPGSYDDDHYVSCRFQTDKPEMVPWKKEGSLI